MSTGVLSPTVKRPKREASHLSPSSVEVKNAWTYTYIPPSEVLNYAMDTYSWLGT